MYPQGAIDQFRGSMGDESVWKEVMPVSTSFSHRLEPAAPHHGSRVPHSPDSSEDVQGTSCPRTSSIEHDVTAVGQVIFYKIFQAGGNLIAPPATLHLAP